MKRMTAVAIGGCCIAVVVGCKQVPGAKSDETTQHAEVEQVTLKAEANPQRGGAQPESEPETRLSEWVLSDERRGRIEGTFEQARGFLNAAEFREALTGINDEVSAVNAVDELAQDKWVLIVAPVEAVSSEGMRLPLFASLEDNPPPSEKKGFSVRVSNVEGLRADAYVPGSRAVILALYQGNKKAGPAYDLLALGHWPGTKEAAQEVQAADQHPAPGSLSAEKSAANVE